MVFTADLRLPCPSQGYPYSDPQAIPQPPAPGSSSSLDSATFASDWYIANSVRVFWQEKPGGRDGDLTRLVKHHDSGRGLVVELWTREFEGSKSAVKLACDCSGLK